MGLGSEKWGGNVMGQIMQEFHVLFLQLGAESVGILFLLKSHCLSMVINVIWPTDGVISQLIALLSNGPGRVCGVALSSWLEQSKFLQSSMFVFLEVVISVVVI